MFAIKKQTKKEKEYIQTMIYVGIHMFIVYHIPSVCV